MSCRQKLIRISFASFLLFATPLLGQSIPPLPTNGTPGGYVGNEACARCHSSVAESYKRTAMARASGPAEADLISGDFTHEKSAVHCRIYNENGRVWLNFERRGAASVSGKRQLLFYIGSGRRGRSYLFATDGFLFEAPVNWYADEHVWDMTPAYQDVKEIPLNLPANPSCLQCHVSGMRPPLKGTENRYREPIESARELYQKALTLEPDLIDAAASFGVIEANQGRLREPIRLWQSAFERAPGRSAIGMNIARVLCGAGEFDRARSSVLRVLEFNPDMAAAKEMLQHLNRTPPMCEQ